MDGMAIGTAMGMAMGMAMHTLQSLEKDIEEQPIGESRSRCVPLRPQPGVPIMLFAILQILCSYVAHQRVSCEHTMSLIHISFKPSSHSPLPQLTWITIRK